MSSRELARKQAEVDHAAREQLDRLLVDGVDGVAGLDRGDARLLDREHQLVAAPLRRREARADGVGARDVGGEAVDLAAGVDEQELARRQRLARCRRSAGWSR